MRNLIYYVGVSLDGYIAGPNGEFDFYPAPDDMAAEMTARYPEAIPHHLRHHVGMSSDEPNKEWDTVLMGRATYDVTYLNGVTSPYAHMKQYVISTTLGGVDDPAVTVVGGDPVELVRRLKNEEGKKIYLCGGGRLAGQLVGEIDELVLKSYPVIAGAGVPAFSGNFDPTLFRPTERREFSNGAQVTWFTRA
ncbi:dihydrofolate reductase family protein [Nocardia sp. NPDC050406]|uniref:dihydrofolate reductase family protein n=1 Tax=Nocardia sp. NPDC050406 TaxID=3364318 RepID=UPI0037AE5114